MWKWNVRGKNLKRIYYYNNKYKKWSTLTTMLMKIKPNIIKIGHIFQIILAEC